MNWLIIDIILFFLGVLLGWIYAHVIVSMECKKLGAFYVGNEVYHCTKITKSEEKE